MNIIGLRMKKVEMELDELRRKWKEASLTDRIVIQKQAEERKQFLQTLKKV